MRIVLFQPDIAQNVGAAMRLCACFEAPLDLIGPLGFPFGQKELRRTAMDYQMQVDVTRFSSWKAYQETEHSGRLVLFTTKGATDLPDFTFKPHDRLLFGRESAGAPSEVHAASDARVIVPLSPQARSLNLVTTVSIALYDGLRQTGGLP